MIAPQNEAGRKAGPSAGLPRFGKGLSRAILIPLIVAAFAAVIWKGHPKETIQNPDPDGCMSCHAEVTDPDPSHPPAALGCAACHLGNPYALDKDRAHFTMVRNPGDLSVVAKTCGQTKCHGDIALRVQNSLMATNRGILKVIQSHWLKTGEAAPAGLTGAMLGEPVDGLSVPDLMRAGAAPNLAIDHYRKMCAGCHLWKPKWDRPGEAGLRGGGCSDCHVPDAERVLLESTRVEYRHPAITTRIPSANCVKCHNRSARIGLSYAGRFESEGYGTPHVAGRLSSRNLSGGRFFMEVAADLHLSKAGMVCIDCHTAAGLMGDGKIHDRMRDQVDIACRDCHIPSLAGDASADDLVLRLLVLNRRVPSFEGRRIGRTARGSPLYHLQADEGRLVLHRKMDGMPVEMKPFEGEKAYHTLKGHERLSCQACHSAWMPQCYGCHLEYRPGERQRDWLTGRESAGGWIERRSYIRFSKPALGVVKDPGRVYPATPCQVFALFGPRAEGEAPGYLRSLSLSGFDPHTTTAASRDCITCHTDPKVIGLGEGVLYRREGRWAFRSISGGGPDSLTAPLPLDGFTTLEGDASVGYRGSTRPFDGGELERILAVGLCLGCHRAYDDPIYVDFERSKERFYRENGLPCRKEPPGVEACG